MKAKPAFHVGLKLVPRSIQEPTGGIHKQKL